jgi:hypothetical protein
MAIVSNINEIMHRIRAKLYPNYLHGVEGSFIARTRAEAPLSIESVCAAAKNRGGFTGNYEDLVEHIKIYLDEAAYQLANGFSVQNGYYSIHPKICGTFGKASDPVDPVKNKIDFSFHTLSRLRELASKITVEIEGVADVTGYIDEVTDIHTGSIDDLLTPGGMLAVGGHKIKTAGDNPDTGVYFVNKADGSRVKVTEHLAENNVSKVIALIPDSLPAGTYTLEIITQYSSGSFFLKEPRTVTCPFDLTVPAAL